MDPKELSTDRDEQPKAVYTNSGLKRDAMEHLKKQLHENIDHMFEGIEYSPNGEAINPIEIESKREFERLALPSGRTAFVPKSVSMTIKTERTAAQFKAYLDDAVAERGVYAAPVPPAPALCMVPNEPKPAPAEDLPSDFRINWKETARKMYEAYGDSVNWKSVSGHPMPKFDDVGPRVEGAWCVAAAAGAFRAPTGLEDLLKTKP